MIRLNDAQYRRVKKLTRCHCANNVRGCCLLLDDGEPCVCVQAISYSLLCRYFRKRCCPQTGSYAQILQPRRTPARNASCAASPFPPAATVQNTVTAVRPMLPGAMQPSASAASGQRRGVSRFKGFKSLAASGFPDTLLEYAGYSYGNYGKRL